MCTKLFFSLSLSLRGYPDFGIIEISLIFHCSKFLFWLSLNFLLLSWNFGKYDWLGVSNSFNCGTHSTGLKLHHGWIILFIVWLVHYSVNIVGYLLVIYWKPLDVEKIESSSAENCGLLLLRTTSGMPWWSKIDFITLITAVEVVVECLNHLRVAR